MKKLLHEPLVHFLLLGVGLFVAYGLVGKRASGELGKFVVTQGQIESLAVGFTRTWQRPPMDTELERLIQDYIREEVYCREAMALGLGKGDIIIRSRLRLAAGIACAARTSTAPLVWGFVRMAHATHQSFG